MIYELRIRFEKCLSSNDAANEIVNIKCRHLDGYDEVRANNKLLVFQSNIFATVGVCQQLNMSHA